MICLKQNCCFYCILRFYFLIWRSLFYPQPLFEMVDDSRINKVEESESSWTNNSRAIIIAHPLKSKWKKTKQKLSHASWIILLPICPPKNPRSTEMTSTSHGYFCFHFSIDSLRQEAQGMDISQLPWLLQHESCQAESAITLQSLKIKQMTWWIHVLSAPGDENHYEEQLLEFTS